MNNSALKGKNFFPEEKYMLRCLQLARCGQGRVSPNPMVGAVIVHRGKIIGEGYHQAYGAAHAEFNAIRSVQDETLLPESVLYVNLEPCSHYGKTPPCAGLIIEKKIPQVVVGMYDPNPQVGGQGIQMLQQAGIQVYTGCMQEACEELNKRFLTFFQKKRPYIILKWAQSSDGFMDKMRVAGDGNEPVQFSSGITRMIMHKQRTEEDAILVGARTVLLDNPWLTVRLWKGRNPLRITIDPKGIIPPDSHIKDQSAPTWIWEPDGENGQENIVALLAGLYERKIQSLIVEGGAATLHHFIAAGLWDEAHVETCRFPLLSGIKAPVVAGQVKQMKSFNHSVVRECKNEKMKE